MTRLRQQLVATGVRRLIGEQHYKLYHNLDWEQACLPFQNADLQYPNYYHQDFHGLQGGYLTPVAAVTYDMVTAWASPPNEAWLRGQLIARIVGQPQRILDLGCGTGSTTVKLKRAFPSAEVIGIDLSPYMLVMANVKAQQQGADILWRQSLAESTTWESDSFDLITASMLFHEMPPITAQAVLREAMRLCKSGGQVITLDGNQNRLRRAQWLIKLFQEPYSQVYAAESVENWMKELGYDTEPTRHLGWIHQINMGRKR